MSKYREVDAVSRSLLVNLINGPHYFEAPDDSDFFVLGTLTEKLYNGDAADYKSMEFPAKTTNLGKLINAYWTHAVDTGAMPDKHDAEMLYNSLGIKKPGFEVLHTDAMEFFEQNGDPDPKTTIVVSEEIMTKAYNMSEKLMHDMYVNKLFNYSNENMQISTSVPLYWETNVRGTMVKCKAELDKLIIDPDEKTIRIVDFKTTGKSVYFFKSSFYKFRYDIQAAFYQSGLLTVKQHKPEFADYTVLPPVFIAVDPYTPHPLVFEVSADTLLKGANGFEDVYGNHNPGWKELLEDYLFYEENGYEYPADYKGIESILIKYTYSTLFLFPLLELPSELFSITKYVNSNYISTRFINAYMGHEGMNIPEDCLCITYFNFGDVRERAFQDTLESLPGFKFNYDIVGTAVGVSVFEIPPKHRLAYSYFKKGMYSKYPSG